VYVLGLAERSDKRDAFALAASLTGFHVEFYDSVRGEDVVDKAKPPVCTPLKSDLLTANLSRREWS
jgi:hypothetical protein